MQRSDLIRQQLYKYIHYLIARMHMATPDELVDMISDISNEIQNCQGDNPQIVRELTSIELGMLRKIAEVEKFFNYQSARLQFGIEQEFNFLQTDDAAIENDKKPAVALPSYMRNQLIIGSMVSHNIASGNNSGIKYSDEETRLFEAGDEPGSNGAFAELRTIILSPLQAIFVSRLAEYAVLNELAANYEQLKSFNYTSLTRHIHFSLVRENTDSEKPVVENLSSEVVGGVYVAIVDGLPLVITPEEREVRHATDFTPTLIEIGNDRKYIITPSGEDLGMPHFELRKVGYGEPRLITDTSIIGIDPLISAAALVAIGAKNGYRKFQITNAPIDTKTYIEQLKRQYPDVNYTCIYTEKANSKGAVEISDNNFKGWFRNMKESKTLEGFGRKLMAEIVAAQIEQNPVLASVKTHSRW